MIDISEVNASIYKVIARKKSLEEIAYIAPSLYNDMVNGSEDTFLSIFSVNKFKAIHI